MFGQIFSHFWNPYVGITHKHNLKSFGEADEKGSIGPDYNISIKWTNVGFIETLLDPTETSC